MVEQLSAFVFFKPDRQTIQIDPPGYRSSFRHLDGFIDIIEINHSSKSNNVAI